MRRIIVPALLAIIAAATIAPNGHAQSSASSASSIGNITAIEKIVRDYLLTNPEILEDAMRALQAKREVEKRNRAQAMIGKNRKALVSHPLSPVSGNPKGDVTLVEFFDYQCGYCKRSLKPLKDLLASDRNLRVVWKEFPILGPVSRFAARAAMAAHKQGRYLPYHAALMGVRGRLSETSVIAIAGQVGLDVERLRRDMKNPAIDAYLDETIGLARTLGIGGTPAFIIGDTLIPGAVGGDRLKEVIAKVRSAG